MARLRLSRAAAIDLAEIQQRGLEDFGLAAVTKHMAGFEEVFALLRRHPLAGAARPELGAAIRSVSHRPHRVFYRYAEGEVVIVRILHAAMDERRAPGMQ